MEDKRIIIPGAQGWDVQRAKLHKVFLPKVQAALDDFQKGWDYHRICGEGATPLVLWNDGLRLRGTAPTICPDPDPEVYNDVDSYETYPTNVPIPQVQVFDPNIELSLEEVVEEFLASYDIAKMSDVECMALVQHILIHVVIN